MSFLAPLFIAGLSAIALPILFHLIRRTPQGHVPFSSLMFLEPSPPRLTRRSRLDNLLLLLLRGLALTCIALAFARPFLREASQLDLSGLRGRRVAILLDTSASMRRANLWQDAQREVSRVLSGLGPADQVAVVAFDERVRTLLDFEEPLPEGASRKTLIENRLTRVTPGWNATDLGAALVTVAEMLVEANDREQSDATLQVILVSDLQQGARLETLQGYQWPREVRLALRSVQPADPTNAALRLIDDPEKGADPKHQRVRVFNDAASRREEFQLQWLTGDVPVGQAESVYVPPGQSRVVRLPRPPGAACDRLLLRGDDCDFDNVFYEVPLRRAQHVVVLVSREPENEVNGLRYYLQRALQDDPWREVALRVNLPSERLNLADNRNIRCVVVAQPPDTEQLDELEAFLRAGGTVLCVLTDTQAAATVSRLSGAEGLAAEEATPGDYVMLAEIDFDHPLFSPFAGASYNDFTKIRFWRHRRIALPVETECRVAARFDDGEAAVLDWTVGAGRLIVLTSGWHPRDSQLARSSKFVPMVSALIEPQGARGRQTRLTVHEPLPLASLNLGDAALSVTPPDGQVVPLKNATREFDQTGTPGLYEVRSASDAEPVVTFAVNLAAEESRTQPLDPGALEQRGAVLGEQPTNEEELERSRQLRDVELERRQQIWKWLIVAGLGLLIAETWLAARRPRSPVSRESEG